MAFFFKSIYEVITYVIYCFTNFKHLLSPLARFVFCASFGNHTYRKKTNNSISDSIDRRDEHNYFTVHSSVLLFLNFKYSKPSVFLKMFQGIPQIDRVGELSKIDNLPEDSGEISKLFNKPISEESNQ